MVTRWVSKKLSALSLLLFAGLLMAVMLAQVPNPALSVHHPKVKEVIAIQEEVTPGIMDMEDILGTAVGQDDDGEPNLTVYVNLEGKNPGKAAAAIPSTLKGVHVSVEITQPFRAMLAKPSAPVSHTAKQTPPIQLGTSGGWGYDLANGYCCGGTLGSLIQKNGVQYILSNYHVFEADIVSGGNNRIAATGDPVIQPGLIDVNCDAASAQNVGTLEVHNSLPLSNVDASIAQVVSGQVRTDGSILEIGTLSFETVAATLNQAVKKSGRTSGLTRSKVSGLNATISVIYDNECAGGTAFTKTYTGQIVIGNKGSKFLRAGDSGSLMVEDVTTKPRAIGLLFAGSSSAAIANPIGQVLSFFDATMVGN